MTRVDLERLDETHDDLAAWPDTTDLPRDSRDTEGRRVRSQERLARAALHPTTGLNSFAPIHPPTEKGPRRTQRPAP